MQFTLQNKTVQPVQGRLRRRECRACAGASNNNNKINVETEKQNRRKAIAGMSLAPIVAQLCAGESLAQSTITKSRRRMEAKLQPVPSQYVYMDFSIKNPPKGMSNGGRVVFGLFGTECPNAVNNFTTLVTSREKGNTYIGTHVAKVGREQFVMAGDIDKDDGFGSKANANQKYFNDDQLGLKLKYNTGALGAYNAEGKDKNVSTFFVAMAPQKYSDGRYVIFGTVTSGLDLINDISRVPVTYFSQPRSEIVITDCGLTDAPPAVVAPAATSAPAPAPAATSEPAPAPAPAPTPTPPAPEST